MGGGGRSGTAERFAETSMKRSDKAFNMGLPMFQRGVGMAQSVLSQGGEPAFLGRALDNAQANAQDATYLNDTAEAVAAIFGRKGTVAGGNTGQALTPESLGAKLARVVAGSETSRVQARVGQMFDAAGVGIGQAGSAGELQTRTLSNQLGAISLMPKSDPTYSTVLAAVNAGMSVYGAGKEAGMWGQPNAQLQPLPVGRSYVGFPGQQQRALPTQFTYAGTPTWVGR